MKPERLFSLAPRGTSGERVRERGFPPEDPAMNGESKAFGF